MWTDRDRRRALAKSCFIQGGDGLLYDKTRPSRIHLWPPPLIERNVALTQTGPPGEIISWTAAVIAEQVSLVEIVMLVHP